MFDARDRGRSGDLGAHDKPEKDNAEQQHEDSGYPLVADRSVLARDACRYLYGVLGNLVGH